MNLKPLLFLISFILGLGILGYLLIKIFLKEYTITSWWRTPSHNAAEGGVWNSMHQIGLGYDVWPEIATEDLSKVWWFPTKIQEGDHTHLGWAG